MVRQHIYQALDHAGQIHIYSPGVFYDDLKNIGAVKIENVQETVDESLKTNPKAAVIPDGPYGVGIVKKRVESMSETAQIILGLIFLIGVYIFTRYGVVWRMKRAVVFVIKDLERGGAFDPSTGAELPYAKTHFFNIGMRDFRPKALQSLIQDGIVGQTDSGRYYLKKRPQDLQL